MATLRKKLPQSLEPYKHKHSDTFCAKTITLNLYAGFKFTVFCNGKFGIKKYSNNTWLVNRISFEVSVLNNYILHNH